MALIEIHVCEAPGAIESTPWRYYEELTSIEVTTATEQHKKELAAYRALRRARRQARVQAGMHWLFREHRVATWIGFVVMWIGITGNSGPLVFAGTALIAFGLSPTKPFDGPCRAEGHDFVKLYGDERLHAGALFRCQKCGKRSDDKGTPPPRWG